MQNKKRGKEGFLKRNYRLSFNYIKQSRKFIYLGMLIFFAFFLLGFFLPIPAELEKELMKIIEQLVKQTEGLNIFELILFIFFNNIQSSFFSIILGFFLGLFPVFVSVVNGYLLGFVAEKSVGSEGILVLWKLLPHGIFELPAIFISFGIGIKFGTFLFQKKKSLAFKEYLFNSVRVFLFVIVPLLILAAIIEGILILGFG
ncbi:MAG: stage II sporulation protein M [archaeon]|nr:stage II sporulation protein M [archaeon]